jgi:vancomycin resistance protein VanK
VRDLPFFLQLYEETRKRHHFVPYPSDFIRAQVMQFSQLTAYSSQLKARCALYLARYQGEVVASSLHMIYGGETSYHHGASTAKYPKVPASYLLQWRAIQDALRRGDRMYNFWGVAPIDPLLASRSLLPARRHPFAGVTTFKTGFGGQLLELVHCMDLPLSRKYWLTFGIETLRKIRRGF